MPFNRPQIAFLAIAALLFAGWTGATHFHLPGGTSANGHVHPASVTGNVGPKSDCGHGSNGAAAVLGGVQVNDVAVAGLTPECELTADCPVHEGIPSPRPACPVSCPDDSSDSAEADCDLCHLLAGQVFDLAISFELAGLVAAEQSITEPLWSAPVGAISTLTCRGPPTNG